MRTELGGGLSDGREGKGRPREAAHGDAGGLGHRWIGDKAQCGRKVRGSLGAGQGQCSCVALLLRGWRSVR